MSNEVKSQNPPQILTGTLSRTAGSPVRGGDTGVPPMKAAQAPQNKHDELRLLVNSRHPIITAETPEEERLEALLFDVTSEMGVPLYEWSVTTGLSKAHGAPIYNTDQPEMAVANIGLIQGDAIFLLKDFAR